MRMETSLSSINCPETQKMNFKILALFATILLALVVFGGSTHALVEDVSDLSLEKEPGSLIY